MNVAQDVTGQMLHDFAINSLATHLHESFVDFSAHGGPDVGGRGSREAGIIQRMECLDFMWRELSEPDFLENRIEPAMNKLALSIKYSAQGHPVEFYPLACPGGVDVAFRTTHEDVTMRTVRCYDVSDDRFITRFDVAFKVKRAQ
jgi:hypothetical protein